MQPLSKMRRRLALPAIALVAGLAACGDSGTNPNRGIGLDAQTAQDAAVKLTAVTDQPLLAAIFGSAPAFERAVPGMGPQLARIGAQTAALRSLRAPAAGARSAQIHASTGVTTTAIEPTVPASALGKTFVLVNGAWQVDASAAPLASNQVRFVVTNASGRLGQVDVFDLTPAGSSTMTKYQAKVTTAGGLEVMNYISTSTETDVGGQADAVTYDLTGTMQNGTTVVSFTEGYSETGIVTGPDKYSFNFHYEAPAVQVTLDFVGGGTYDAATGSDNLTQADYTVAVHGTTLKWSFDPVTGNAKVYVNGQLYATAATDLQGNLTYTSAGGGALSASDRATLDAVDQVIGAMPEPTIAELVISTWLAQAGAATTG